MKVVLCALLFLFTPFVKVFSQNYTLDSSFATNGIYLGDTGVCVAVKLQSDGKIVIAGGEQKAGKKTIAMRFHSNGSIDSSFGTNGRVYLYNHLALGSFTITAMVLQPDDKIVVAGIIDTGTTKHDFLLVRLNPNGNFDSSFGSNGYTITSYHDGQHIDIAENLSSIALQPDGKILACGSFENILDTVQVVRYLTNGNIDNSFGQNGRAKLHQGFHSSVPNDITVLPDGRIVLGLNAKINALNDTGAFTAIRLLSNGNYDSSFNHTGVFYTHDPILGNDVFCTAMAVQSDGKIILTGYGHVDTLTVTNLPINSLLRIDTNGTIDINFGEHNGFTRLPFSIVHPFRSVGILIAPNQNIHIGIYNDVVSWIAGNYYPNYIVANCLSNGKIDSSSGTWASIRGATNSLNCFTLQPDESILIGGKSLTRLDSLVLVRYKKSPTSIHQIDWGKTISIYPNPANNLLQINNNSSFPVTSLSIYSIEGKKIYTEKTHSIQQINTAAIPSGMYFIKITLSNQQEITKKMVVQH